MPKVITGTLCLAFIAVSLARAQDPEMKPNTLTINTVAIQGIDRIVQVKPIYNTPQGLAELDRAVAGDGLDEVVFLMPDTTLWLAYGRHINLYTRTADRVQTAYAALTPVRVLSVDDENRGADFRPPLSRMMLIVLAMIVLVGLGAGAFVGTIARRSLSGLGRDPLIDRAFYGLILGILAALLVYGLSNRRLDLRGLVTNVSERHLYQYMVSPPR